MKCYGRVYREESNYDILAMNSNSAGSTLNVSFPDAMTVWRTADNEDFLKSMLRKHRMVKNASYPDFPDRSSTDDLYL